MNIFWSDVIDIDADFMLVCWLGVSYYDTAEEVVYGKLIVAF